MSELTGVTDAPPPSPPPPPEDSRQSPDASAELVTALAEDGQGPDPDLSRKTWEATPDGTELPQSMREDLRDLGGDLREDVDPAAWEKAGVDERKDMLDAANDRIREEYGLPQQDVSYRSEAEDPRLAGLAGYLDPNTGEIAINSDQLADSDPQEALKTLAHENFHSYQLQAMDGGGSDPFARSRAEDWQDGLENYPVASDYDSIADYINDYKQNPLERDAFAVEREVYAGYREDKP